jgi:hypothetical protein
MTPERLIDRLQRTVDELRWFRLIEANGGDILRCEGRVTVTMTKDGQWLYGDGPTLRDALAAIDADIAERATKARRARAWEKLMATDKGA